MKPPHIQQNKCCEKCNLLSKDYGTVVPCENCPCHSTPTQPEWMKGLREDFYKEQCELKDDSDRLGIYENDAELVADWWLNKFSTIIQKEIERERLSIVEECERQKKLKGVDEFANFKGKTDEIWISARPVKPNIKRLVRNSVLTSIQEFIKSRKK